MHTDSVEKIEMKTDLSLTQKLVMWLRWQKWRLVLLIGIIRGYRFKSVGKCFTICDTTSIFKKNSVSIGDYVFIGAKAHFCANVQIGHFTMIATNVAVVGGDHRFDMVGVPTRFTGRDRKEKLFTIIEDDVWVGHGTIIMSGVKIGRGAIVAAGSVVTKDVPPYAVVGGVPAKLIRYRFTPEQQKLHNESIDRLIKSKNAEGESYLMMQKILAAESQEPL